MSKATKCLVTLAGAVLTVAVGCSDSRTTSAVAGPGPVGPAANSVTGTLGTVTGMLIPPVTRNTPLASDVVWSFTAGPDGAVSINRAVGLAINIPSGALSSTQTITVTALAGSPVAYGFEPHLVFAKPVSLVQNIAGTSLDGLTSLPLLSGAHFDTDRLQLSSDGLAIVSEIVPAAGNLLSQTAGFNVSHFSGWILASGRGEER